jgi:hypothetical protein
MTQRTNLVTRAAQRAASVLAEIRRAQHRMNEILTNPTGE